MKQQVLKIFLCDEGMNTGQPDASKIGGGQIARKRFFSDPTLFQVTILTSVKEIADFWEGLASIIYEPNLQTYRPSRIHISRQKANWLQLFKDCFRAEKLFNRYLLSYSTDRVDVIFLNDNKYRFIYIINKMLRFWRKDRLPVAIQVDGEWKLGLFDFLMKIMFLLLFDKIVCPTKAIRESLGITGKLFSKKLLTAYPGVEKPCPSEIRQGFKKKSGDDIIFGCIGTLRTAVKGQDIMIEAVNSLVKNYGPMPIKVYFFGDGPDKQTLEKLIQKYNLCSYFIFKGYVSDQKEIYKQIDVCIVASRTETASIVLMESLIRNIPVISSNLDACKEILFNFYTDLLFQQSDPDSLMSLLEKILNSDILEKVQERLRKTSKDIITKDYQVKRVYEFLST